ncbi:cytochrome P450 [Gigaspora margarita]|uniref:Cytochrome P450 n=1 Tax=Gigaspora margarita TaxID=4874 RepID=A0A8H4B1Y1_GIGMA|nr:cytochrome P450 [Gigaspora margarita]
MKLFYKKCRSEYGNICEIMIDGHRCIILSRPEYIEKVMISKHLMRFPYLQGLDEIGIFMDTAVNSTNKLFEELSKYWQSLGNQNASNNNNGDNWTLETDFSAWFHAFTNDIISIIATDGSKFVKALIKYVEGLLLFMLVGPFLRHYIPIIRNKANSYLKNRDYIHEKLNFMIKKRKKEIEEMSVGAEMRTDMLTSLIIANTEKDTFDVKTVGGETFEPMTDEEIRSNLIEAFFGGTDSTYLSSDDLSKLKYYEAIIKETSRVMPVLTFLTRYINEEYEVAGYKWGAGTIFHLNIVGVHSHPEVWPNPEIFNPDRFYGVDDKRSENKGSLIIFGGGQRMCPGRKLAMCELLLLMASIYRYFNVELVNINEPLKIVTSTNNNVEELKVRISPRIN